MGLGRIFLFTLASPSMNKLIATAVLVLFGVIGVHAQTTLGIKGGLNVATIRIPGEVVDPRIGFHVGGFASTPISSRFALQPEVLYSKQGVETRHDVYTFHYINIPLIFKGSIAGGLHVQVGPQFGVLLDAERRTGNVSYDITESRNRYDGAIALGLGYDVGSWQVSGRYNVGLSDTRDGRDGGKYHANNVFQLSLGYKVR
jgi:hypothetical protein